MPATAAPAGSTEWTTGSWRWSRTSCPTSPSRVAENSMRWPSGCTWASSPDTCGRKPRSHIWSASSRTVIRTRPSRAGVAFSQVVQASGGGDDDLGPLAQLGDLTADRQPADDGRHPQPQRLGVRLQRLRDLLGQLAGGHQDQGEGLLGFGAPPGDTGQQRQAEGEGLAGAGASAPQDVASAQRVGQRGGLHGEGCAHAEPVQGAQYGVRQAQGGEGAVRRVDGGGAVASGRAGSP